MIHLISKTIQLKRVFFIVKTSTFEDGYGRKKRPSSVSQLNNFLAEAKKNRPEPPSCPTLKVMI
jgi:hypothetical protein